MSDPHRRSPIEVGLGIGLMVLAGTAPLQIVFASRVDPPEWIALATASAALLAGLGALGAAYFSFQQAEQVRNSRLADHLLPVIRLTREQIQTGLDAVDGLARINRQSPDSIELPLKLREPAKQLADEIQEVAVSLHFSSSRLGACGSPRLQTEVGLLAAIFNASGTLLDSTNPAHRLSALEQRGDLQARCHAVRRMLDEAEQDLLVA